MYTHVRRGKKIVVYKVALNCAPVDDVPRIIFGTKDKWVGVDYWTYVQEYTPTRGQRVLSIMNKFERNDETNCWLYVLARKIAYLEFFGVKI